MQLSSTHAALIGASAISTEFVEARGYWTSSSSAELERLGFAKSQRRHPALIIPIWDVYGERAGFQIRPDFPREANGKQIKYETPKGFGMRIDVPPLCGKDIRNPSVPLFITEGIRKADAAGSVGLCCIALLGVWNWKGTNTLGGKTILPDWGSIALNERRVYLVFDSDAWENPNVYEALVALRDFLHHKTADVRIVYLPPAENGRKQGLDDYLAAGGTRDSLLALASEELRPRPNRKDPASASAGPYFVRNGSIFMERDTKDGPISWPLCNFDARIVGEEVLDNGAETLTRFNITGALENGSILYPISVPASLFPKMDWVTSNWGAKPVVAAGAGTKDHLRAAIQMLSGEFPRRVIYGHTGWREIDGDWFYLTAAGAYGATGRAEHIEVDLGDGRLRDYVLPVLPEDPNEVRQAVRASLALLRLAPLPVTYPLLCAIYRAPLGQLLPVDFSLFLVGDSGSQKSELTAMAQAHFGAAFHRKHLPGNWTSSSNSLEKQAFLIKDAIFTIDDFAPGGSQNDITRLHREADRIFRNAGNRAGRGRMRADGTLRPDFYPQGLVVSSGEDVPMGKSLKARLIIVEVERGTVDLNALTLAQEHANAGCFALSMSGYIHFLAGRMEKLGETLHANQEEWRADIRAREVTHDRTPENLAGLLLGLDQFLAYAVAIEAITKAEAMDYFNQGYDALCLSSDSQASHQSEDDPVERFLQLVRSSVLTGNAHFLNPLTGHEPDNAERYGWRETEIGTGDNFRREWRSRGPSVGWVDETEVYLDPDGVFAMVQKFGKDQGMPLPVSQQTLWKRMRERGLLVREDTRETNKVRRTICGVRLQVIQIRLSLLFNSDET